MDRNSTVYTILQNKIFLSFNEWLTYNDYDFRFVPEEKMNQLIATYTDFIQAQLIDLMEQYRNAD